VLPEGACAMANTASESTNPNPVMYAFMSSLPSCDGWMRIAAPGCRGGKKI
jgi:hypothetical protein